MWRTEPWVKFVFMEEWKRDGKLQWRDLNMMSAWELDGGGGEMKSQQWKSECRE
ncbi:uncharacterized protein G2W53_039843 [Senna tora]|uniref:Uncharacterized protein n=1 Tax=Senna tora TaxID=362788 RepID=A0A834W342_9FABA|nr:uncharacterized protein G2W53_039843 [Senna tora]